MTTKGKVIAGVVGGVLVIGGIGSIFGNKTDSGSSSNSDSSIWESTTASVAITSSASSAIETVDISKVYAIDEFCSLFENDEDFSQNYGGTVFTISGSIDDKLYSSVEFYSGFKSEKWNTNYRISCKFNGKDKIKDISEKAVVTISGSLFSLATSGIVLDDCSLVSVDDPVDDVSSETASTSKETIETSAESTSEDIWETEATEPIEIVETSVNTSAETEQTVTWETVGNKKAEKTYVLNTSTLKIHSPGCSSVKDIKPENYSETNDYDAAISQGYKPCGRCHAR